MESFYLHILLDLTQSLVWVRKRLHALRRVIPELPRAPSAAQTTTPNLDGDLKERSEKFQNSPTDIGLRFPTHLTRVTDDVPVPSLPQFDDLHLMVGADVHLFG